MSLKSTGLCSCLKGLRATITTAIQIYGSWPLPRNFRVYAEFREIPWKYGNSAATAKFRGSARNSAARGKLWALFMSPAQMAEAIEMPFGMLTWVGRRNHISDGGAYSPLRNGHFWGGGLTICCKQRSSQQCVNVTLQGASANWRLAAHALK